MDDAHDLTPSEIELIKASAREQSILFGHLPRMLTGESFLSLPLLEQVFFKALEANQAAGNLICQIQYDRALFFGFSPRQKVMIRANGREYGWPEPSLEASLHSLARSLSGRSGAVPLAALVSAWLEEAAIHHLQTALRWVYDALAERGWVNRTLEKRLELFTLPCYEIPRRTRRLVEEYGWNLSMASDNRKEAEASTSEIIENILHKEFHRLQR